MTDVGIDGISHVLPGRVVTSDELAGRFVDREGAVILRPGMLERLTGVAERRWVDEGVCSSDLAGAATAKALADCGVDPRDVELLVFASASGDVVEPATGNRVQAVCGCVNARVMDVKNACNSFIDGLDVAAAMIRGGSVDCAVVATGEVLSQAVELRVDGDVPKERLFAGLTLGDAGAAVVVRPWSERSIVAVGEGSFLTAGEHWELSTIMAGGTITGRDFSRSFFVCDSEALFKLAIEYVPQVIRQTLARLGWPPASVDLVVPHQASTAVIRRIAEAVGIGFDRCVVTARDLGNTAAASVPMALSVARDQGRLDGARRVLLVGGAAGFSAAALPLTVGPPGGRGDGSTVRVRG